MYSSELKFKELAAYHSCSGIVFVLTPKQKNSCCPLCNKSSNRIHSFYTRRLADLPISGKLVQIRLNARRFFCRNKKCAQSVFTERFKSDILPYARRLTRSADLLRNIGLLVGGNKGALLSHFASNPVSPSTILRLVRRLEIKEPAITSGIVGVDDWAFKKGRNYGTIIVDLEQRKAIDLLPDREADTLARWLLNYPEIHTVSRDRASTYSKGIKDGTENAIEVADRFHLLVNLREAFKKTLYRHNPALKKTFVEYSFANSTSPEGHNKTPLALPKPKPYTPNPEREMKFKRAKELARQGYGIKSIAKALNAHHRTIKKYLLSEEFPRKEAPAYQKYLTNFFDFKEYLLENYSKFDNQTLYATIRNQGFNGKYSQFCHNMNRFIKPEKTKTNLPRVSRIETWSNTKISFLVLQQEDKLSDKDLKYLKFLYQKIPQIKATAELTKSFKNLFLEKTEGSLQSWLTKALDSTSELQNFAKGIQKDFDAVNQAVISNVSNGQVEGQVNKLKTVKRMMYGRASFKLLRTMVLASSA